ncbi:MAG: PEP-CTERM sorting domain-containing protein [Phenylobacterium sp.]
MLHAAKTGLAGLVVTVVGLAAAPAFAAGPGAACPGRAPVGVTGSSIAAPQAAPGNCTTVYDGVAVTLSGKPMGAVTDSYTGTTYQYDRHGDIVAQTSADGITSYFGQTGPVTEVTDPQGHTTRFTYDAQHDVTAVIDPQGKVTTYAYDAQDRVTGAHTPQGTITTYDYDPVGRMDSSGNGMTTTTYDYDPLGRIADSTTGGNTTTYHYDAGDGDLTQVMDPLGRTTTYQYDALNRVISETDVLGGVTSTYTYAYDADGNVVGEIDDLGGVTTTYSHTYDAQGNLIEQQDSTGRTIYDTWGNGLLQSQTDPLGHTTTYTYDPLFRLVGESGPDGAFSFTPGGIPEPAAWALMLIGFGALGLRLRGAGATRRRVFA